MADDEYMVYPQRSLILDGGPYKLPFGDCVIYLFYNDIIKQA